MRTLEIGLVLPMEESWTDGATPRWVGVRHVGTTVARPLRTCRRLKPQRSNWARNEGLLTGQPTLGIPSPCHNA